jgi:cysteine-rich repeat protein
MQKGRWSSLVVLPLGVSGCIPWSSLYETVCGDHHVDADEECDDGNKDDTDSCLSTCKWARCGDGFVRRSVEECDPAANDAGSGCSDTCLACSGPASWLETGSGHCFTYHSDKQTVVAAGAICAEASSSLLTFPKYEDPGRVYDGFLANHPDTIWLGLYRNKAGYFVWTTTGETPRLYGTQLRTSVSPADCVTQSPPLNATSWQAVLCTDTAAYVCEKAPVALRPVDNHAYRVFYDRLNWQEAMNTCIALGGHLVTIHDAEEETFVALLARVDFWIGASDVAEFGKFVWVTGEPFEFSDFSPLDGNGDGTNHCTIMNALDYNRWYDRRCSDKNAFVCEYD